MTEIALDFESWMLVQRVIQSDHRYGTPEAVVRAALEWFEETSDVGDTDEGAPWRSPEPKPPESAGRTTHAAPSSPSSAPARPRDWGRLRTHPQYWRVWIQETFVDPSWKTYLREERTTLAGVEQLAQVVTTDIRCSVWPVSTVCLFEAEIDHLDIDGDDGVVVVPAYLGVVRAGLRAVDEGPLVQRFGAAWNPPIGLPASPVGAATTWDEELAASESSILSAPTLAAARAAYLAFRTAAVGVAYAMLAPEDHAALAFPDEHQRAVHIDTTLRNIELLADATLIRWGSRVDLQGAVDAPFDSSLLDLDRDDNMMSVAAARICTGGFAFTPPAHLALQLEALAPVLAMAEAHRASIAEQK